MSHGDNLNFGDVAMPTKQKPRDPKPTEQSKKKPIKNGRC